MCQEPKIEHLDVHHLSAKGTASLPFRVVMECSEEVDSYEGGVLSREVDDNSDFMCERE